MPQASSTTLPNTSVARVPFNKPCVLGEELTQLTHLLAQATKLSGNGAYTQKCQSLIEAMLHEGTPLQDTLPVTAATKVLLTHSCTAALEMSALLLDLKAGDEVILPSYTFCSTANAFALRGVKLVFVDIRPDTLNLDETLLAEAITPQTKAICVVHYAGQVCEMAPIMALANAHKLWVIEDAAQAYGSRHHGAMAGTLGHLACFSFHETKNIHAGEGGCLVVNDPRLIERAEIIWEKGTNRSQFFRGQVDKYTWLDIGSSYLPSELVAAFLMPQLQHYHMINTQRIQLASRYHEALHPWASQYDIQCPQTLSHNENNGHMFHLRFPSLAMRTAFIQHMEAHHIYCPFHYVPLHSAPAGEKYGMAVGSLPVTTQVADTLVRLPLFYDLTPEAQTKIIDVCLAYQR
ncbi:MAG: dTDP-4-amino-4,6-dideoxygalactose transaminase [Vampirovibrionales bacterium]